MRNLLSGTAAVVPVAAAAIIMGWTAERPASVSGASDRMAVQREVGGMEAEYGVSVPIGHGTARTYVIFDTDQRTPLELGVAIDAAGLHGLPDTMAMMHLPLPSTAPGPYRFVMFEWNPEGHEPEGIYTMPHFDFHFYTVPHSVVDGIDPIDPKFAERANKLPREGFVPEHYFVFAAPDDPPAAVAVPQMGVHWVDVRSPEIQGAIGKPEAYQPFSKTLLYGSWDGRFIFYEPMITREFLLSRPSELVSVPQPARFDEPGWYPNAYRIEFDMPSDTYRVALTGLTWFE